MMETTGPVKPTPLICFVVVSIAVVGFFVGLQSPVTSASPANGSNSNSPGQKQPDESVLPATRYADMSSATRVPAIPTNGLGLMSSTDPLAKVEINPEDKLIALAKRDRNRAFNGAPPTIPHPVDQTTTASCMACHGEGARTISLRIPRVSHQFLTNCTQCHVESQPRHMAAILFRESEFDGLKAPTEGPRAFTGAPPQIPHSTWMRSDCLSCHGIAGLQGIRTTHPWRKNCQQCHAPSATMDQTLLAPEVKFLPGPKLDK